MENLEGPGPLDLKENVVRQVHLEKQDQRDHLGHQVIVVTKENRDLADHADKMDNQAWQENGVNKLLA